METTPLLATSPPTASFRSSEGFIVFTVAAAVFTDLILYAAVVPVLPYSLHERIGLPLDQVQRAESNLLALFGLAALIASPICGALAHRWGNRRTPFLCGLLFAIVGTLLLGLATSYWVLALSRIFQGLASTIVFVVGLALIGDTVPAERMGKAIGFALSGVSVGYLVAPTVAGIIYEKLGYVAVFWACTALLTMDVLLRLLAVEPKTRTAMSSARNPNQSTSVHREIVTQSCAASGSSRLSASKTESKPLSGLRLLGNPRFFCAFFGYSVYTSNMSALDAVLARFVKEEFHWTSSFAGMIYLTVGIPALAAPLVGHLSDRWGTTGFVVTGFLSTATLQYFLRYTAADGDLSSRGREILLCILLTFIGISLCFMGTPLATEMSACVESVEGEDPDAFQERACKVYAQAFGLLNIGNAIGLLAGPTFAGTLVDNYGWKNMSMGLAMLTLSGGLPTIVRSCYLWAGKVKNHQ
ncbi:major facilitator superfamily domain-containing protein [Aspergillus transmontanensis]|uniref:Major facilitator superfamily domain-containing protein n=1 Tax=Aspergillus transmontanensis TaxID=1034304 RepID=A0A5N6W478_9EURO|nr:major facilitator superfamily domain-containing protein [Aspergillus transmontanensis]